MTQTFHRAWSLPILMTGILWTKGGTPPFRFYIENVFALFFQFFWCIGFFCYYHTFSLVLWDCWGSWCGGFCGWKEEKLRFSGFISWFIFFIIFCSASFDIGGGRVSRIGCFHWRDGQRQTGWLCASCVQTCRAQGSRKGFFL